MADSTEKDFTVFFRNDVLPQMRLCIRDRLKEMRANSGIIGPKELEALCLVCCKSAGVKMQEYLQRKEQPSIRFSKETTHNLFVWVLHEINSELPEEHDTVMALGEDEEGMYSFSNLRREVICRVVEAGAEYRHGMVPVLRVMLGAQRINLEFEMPVLPG